MKSNRGRREKSDLDIEITNEIGNEIKKARKEKKISQMQLSKMMNVSVDSIRNWEQGKYKPAHEDNYVMLYRILGIDLRPIVIESRHILDSLDMKEVEKQELLQHLLMKMGYSLPYLQLVNPNVVPFLFKRIEQSLQLLELEQNDFIVESVKDAMEDFELLHKKG